MGNSDAPKEEEHTSGKKVVRVVRRVIRRVIPAATEQPNQPAEVAKAVSTADATVKPNKAATEDDISMGLTSLMGRSRTKEHRPRTRPQDRKEDGKEEQEKETVEEEEGKPSVVSHPSPRTDPLTPPPGFIPTPNQNLLSPPPGFIPARKSSPVPPKQKPQTRPPGFIPVTKTDPLAPPVGFIPKPRPATVKKPEVLSGKGACLLIKLSGACVLITLI